MATWWLTESIDLSATALLPLVVFPLFGIANMVDTAAPYAHPLIFLFMGGFIQALSMRRWGWINESLWSRFVWLDETNQYGRRFHDRHCRAERFCFQYGDRSVNVANCLSVVSLTDNNVRRSRNKTDAPIQKWRYRQEFNDVLDAWHCLRPRRLEASQRSLEHRPTFFWLVFSVIRFPSRIEWK